MLVTISYKTGLIKLTYYREVL